MNTTNWPYPTWPHMSVPNEWATVKLDAAQRRALRLAADLPTSGGRVFAAANAARELLERDGQDHELVLLAARLNEGKRDQHVRWVRVEQLVGPRQMRTSPIIPARLDTVAAPHDAHPLLPEIVASKLIAPGEATACMVLAKIIEADPVSPTVQILGKLAPLTLVVPAEIVIDSSATHVDEHREFRRHVYETIAPLFATLHAEFAPSTS